MSDDFDDLVAATAMVDDVDGPSRTSASSGTGPGCGTCKRIRCQGSFVGHATPLLFEAESQK